MDVMENLLVTIQENFTSFKKDATAQIEKGNKAAGTRARKISLTIEKALKEFRKKSIKASNE
jgi:hypothetical protein